MAIHVRRAAPDELDAVFMMGFDVWSDGQDRKAYLASCRASPKYARGEWRVLADGAVLLSSLIVYRLDAGARGLGSIATPRPLRGQGHATRLIAEVVAELERFKKAEAIFLFADIAPGFYRKLGFVPLPDRWQKSARSVCMLRGPAAIFNRPGFQPPSYF